MNNPKLAKANGTVGVFSGLPSICKKRSDRFWKLTATLIFINKSNAEAPKKCVAADFTVILGFST